MTWWRPSTNYPVHGRHRRADCRCHWLIGSDELEQSDWAKTNCKPCGGRRQGHRGDGGRHTRTGIPNWFMCPQLRIERNDARFRHLPSPDWKHTWHRTGRTKPRGRRRGLPRMTDLQHEYVCTCGHTGWTAHKDILQAPVVTPQSEGDAATTKEGKT